MSVRPTIGAPRSEAVASTDSIRRGALAGALVGSTELLAAVYTSALGLDSTAWTGLFAALALGALLGGPLGLLWSWGTHRFLRFAVEHGTERYWPRRTWLLLALVVTPIGWFAGHRGIEAVLGLQDTELVADFLVGAVVFLAVAGPAGFVFLSALDRAAPAGRRPGLWEAVGSLVALQWAALALYFGWRHRLALGLLAIVPSIVAQLCIWWALPSMTLTRSIGRPGLARLRATATAATLVGIAAFARGAGSDRLLEKTVMPRAVGQLLGACTDFDRDGHPTLFSGSDCAPFDPLRHPSAVELPGNGIDENCSGADATIRAAPLGHELQDHWAPNPELVRKYNVVIIVIEALRVDRVRMHRRGRPLMPNLVRLAEEAIYFETAYSQSSATSISLPSLLTGRNPLQLPWDLSDRVPQMPRTEAALPERLKTMGYRTALITNRWVLRRMSRITERYDVHKDIWRGQNHKRGRRASAPTTTGYGIAFIEAGIDEAGTKPPAPFFLTLYYEEPHGPYEDHQDRGIPSFGKRPEDRYDAEVAFADRHLGGFLDYLRHDEDLWSNTVVVVTADHGEEFGEHGGKHHDRTCYTESVRVPLVLRRPGGAAQVVRAPVALVDVAPTILSLVGAAEPTQQDGVSLLATVAEPRSAARRPIYCARFQGDKKNEITQSVRTGAWTLVQTHRGRELYDRQRDRGEQNNIVAKPASKGRVDALTPILEAGGMKILAAPKSTRDALK